VGSCVFWQVVFLSFYDEEKCSFGGVKN